MRKLSLYYLMILIALFCSPAFAEEKVLGDVGEGNIHAGPLEIHPSLAVVGTYSDNIYKSYNNQDWEYDFYATVSPGVLFILPIDDHSLQLGGRADFYKYSEFEENDHNDVIAGGVLDLNFACDLSISISDYHSESQINRKWKEQEGVSGSADMYRELPYTSNDFTAKTKYSFADNWAVATWVDYLENNYYEDYDDYNDYWRGLYGASLFYSITKKIDVLAEYNLSRVNYRYADGNDNINHMSYVGLSFDPTAKLNGYVKLGWARKELRQNEENKAKFAAGILEKHYDTLSALVDLGYVIDPYNLLGLKASRVLEDDIDTNAPLRNTDVSLGYKHIFSQNTKVALNANVGYGEVTFQEESIDLATGINDKRDDAKLYGSAGVDYALQKWLSLGGDYTYVNNDSNFKTYDYSENKVSLSAEISF